MTTRLLMAGLVVFGGWQIGHSGYLLAKAELAQWLLEQAWQEMQLARKEAMRLQGDAVDFHVDGLAPWPWADTWPMARMHWPSLQQDQIVLAGASGRNLAFGPAHLSASVLPGEVGVSVIGGHRDTHFAFLQDVMIGDQFVLETAEGIRIGFQVKEIHITDVRHSRIALDASIPKIALVACYPFVDWEAGSPLRYLVIAEALGQKFEQVPPTTAEMLTTMSL